MTLDEFDKALQTLGWTRIDRRTWSSPPRLITLTHGKCCDPWELKTINGIDPIKREYFRDARDTLAAVRRVTKGR